MFSHIYRNALVPVDCSEGCRRAAFATAEFFVPHQNCMVTLQATVSPSATPEQRQKKIRHAEEALLYQAEAFQRCGVYARRRIVEAPEGNIAAAVAQTLNAGYAEEPFDLIVLSTTFATVEPDDMPCQGSILDRIVREAARTGAEVTVLPAM